MCKTSPGVTSTDIGQDTGSNPGDTGAPTPGDQPTPREVATHLVPIKCESPQHLDSLCSPYAIVRVPNDDLPDHRDGPPGCVPGTVKNEPGSVPGAGGREGAEQSGEEGARDRLQNGGLGICSISKETPRSRAVLDTSNGEYLSQASASGDVKDIVNTPGVLMSAVLGLSDKLVMASDYSRESGGAGPSMSLPHQPEPGDQTPHPGIHGLLPADSRKVDGWQKFDSTVTPGTRQVKRMREPQRKNDVTEAGTLPENYTYTLDCLDHVTHGLDHVTHGLDHVTQGPDQVTHSLDHVTHGLDHVTHGQDHVTHSLEQYCYREVGYTGERSARSNLREDDVSGPARVGGANETGQPGDRRWDGASLDPAARSALRQEERVRLETAGNHEDDPSQEPGTHVTSHMSSGSVLERRVSNSRKRKAFQPQRVVYEETDGL